jgi:glycosyltransferase involved in cell wall biosynthesis
VRVIGAVEDVLPYYRQCGVSVCPLLSGSGTRLKILEAISAGNPVVSTSVGCEGLQLQDGREILIRDTPGSFAAAVVQVMQCAEHFKALRTAARIRAESVYDWRVIGRDMCRDLLSRCRRKL